MVSKKYGIQQISRQKSSKGQVINTFLEVALSRRLTEVETLGFSFVVVVVWSIKKNQCFFD